MPRLAWFSPLPPVKSGIAQYNRELLPALAASTTSICSSTGRRNASHRRMHVFGCSARTTSSGRHRARPYDLVVYQLGNAPCHDYMWAYLTRYPGLVVLHDGQLHHARGRMLLQRCHRGKKTTGASSGSTIQTPTRISLSSALSACWDR